MKTFNTLEGRIAQREARKKLAKLDKNLPPALLREIYAFYLKDAPYDLWPALKHTRPEHADLVAEAVVGDGCIQARFVSASHEQDPSKGVQRAGGLLALMSRTSHLPGCWASLAKHWGTLEAVPLAKAASVALAAHGGPPNLVEIRDFFGLVYVVARVTKGDPAIVQLRAASSGWKGWEDTIERAVAAAAP